MNWKGIAQLGVFSLLINSALPLVTNAEEPPAPDLSKERLIDGFPESMQPWRDPDNRNVQILDPGWDYYFKRRDMIGDNPKREPGPIDLQRYQVATTKTGFPTMFGLPFAMTTEDLKAGEVDVAIAGLPSTFNPSEGTGWAANQLRFIRNYDFAGVGHDFWFNNHYFDIINVVDYGNANNHPSLMMQNFADQALLVKEILDGGAMPMVIGGDHGTQVAMLMAIVDHYGPKEIALVHFDAHTDLAAPGGRIGMFTHGGAARRFAYEEGWVKGEDMHSIGLRGAYDDTERIQWMRKIGDQYHTMVEFERYGFDPTWRKVRDELKGKKLYISVDMDVIDPAHVPGVSNPEIGGFTTLQMMRMLRELFLQNEVVAIDFVEYSPLLDDRRYNTANTISRLMRHVLAAAAARKEGITDPDYVAPEVLSHE